MHPQAKEKLVLYGRKMVEHHLTSGSGGNLSIIDRDTGQIAITPSGLDYFETHTEDIVICGLDGQAIGKGRKPSSEINFHLALYKLRHDIGAIVHTHSIYATTLACMHKEIPPVHYLVGFAGDKVPLAPYATFGTQQLAQSITGAIGTSNAILLANHGLVAVGPTLPRAFTVAQEIEQVARIYYQTLAVGTPKLLSKAQMDAVRKQFKTYGQS